MTDADGLALLFWVGAGGLVLLLVALLAELAEVRAMRRRKREREALTRYCRMIEDSNYWRQQ